MRDGSAMSARLLRSVMGDDHSLSVAAELEASSISPTTLLPLPPPLADPGPDAKLNVDEDALLSRSFDFSVPSRSLNILERASW